MVRRLLIRLTKHIVVEVRALNHRLLEIDLSKLSYIKVKCYLFDYILKSGHCSSIFACVMPKDVFVRFALFII